MHATKNPVGTRRWRARGPEQTTTARKDTNAVCWRCRAVRLRGRWTHTSKLPVPADICLPAALCPACVAIRNHDAGHVLAIETLPADRLRELAAVVRNAAAAERSTRTGERVVFVRRRGDRITVGTTDLHLARRIGAVLLRAWKKHLRVLRRDDVVTLLAWRPDGVDAARAARPSTARRRGR